MSNDVGVEGTSVGMRRRPKRNAAQDPLGWVVEALREPDGGQPAHDFLIVPSVRRPRALVSCDRLRASRQALRLYSNATRLKGRVGAEALALGLRFDVPSVVQRRLRLALGDVRDPGSLSALLADAAGLDRPVFSVSVGARRPQSKPVIHVLTRGGRPVAHAKLGWNAVTIPLVAQERQMLELVRRASPRSFRVPPILYAGTWMGREVLVVRHDGARPWYRPANLRLPVDATIEVPRLGDRQRAVLPETAYWRGLQRRVVRVADAGGELADVLVSVLARIGDRYSKTRVQLGAMHGDWAPWNMSSAHGLLVWDWERGNELGPVGLDALYFLLQTDLWVRGRETEAAFAACRARAGSLLGALGLESQDPSLLVALLGLEIALRQEEGAVAGVPVPSRIHRAMRHLPSLVGPPEGADRRTGVLG